MMDLASITVKATFIRTQQAQQQAIMQMYVQAKIKNLLNLPTSYVP